MQRAFTLIELLITIAILAILGSSVALVLNPAELLAQSRDSERLQDLEALKKSLSLTLIDNPSLLQSLSSSNIYLSLPSCTGLTPPSGFTYLCSATPSNINGSGWIPLSLSNLPNLPLDPTNSSSSSLYYAFIPDPTNKTFVITSLLESEKYLKSASIKDGGTDPARIEEGNPALWTAASGLVGYWPMDEGSGTVAGDYSGSGNNGIVSGGAFWQGGCRSESCLYLDGVDDSVSAINPLSSQPNLQQEWSVSAWVKIQARTDQQLLNFNSGVKLNHGSTNRLLLYLNSGANDYYDYGLYNVQDDIWHHVVFVFKNSTGLREIYVDGVDYSTTGPNYTSTPSGMPGTMLIGNGSVKGLLDELRIYKRTLSAAEIKSAYVSQK